jgi:hypothetical protein
MLSCICLTCSHVNARTLHYTQVAELEFQLSSKEQEIQQLKSTQLEMNRELELDSALIADFTEKVSWLEMF